MSSKQRTITIKDIARKAGVSIATVSRATNPDIRSLVADETLQTIDEAIRQLGYTPNLAARNLRATRCKTLGVLIPHIPNVFVSDYHAKIFSGISNALLDSGYRFKLIAFKPDPGAFDKYPFRSAEGIDGLILTYWPMFFSKKSILEKLDLPVVIVNDPEDDMHAHFVAGDSVQGAQLAAKYLYEKGHRRVAILAGNERSSDSRTRVETFRKFYEKAGVKISSDFILRGNFEEEDAYRATGWIDLKKDRITAVFCCNDDMAYGVLRRLRESGLSSPEDVSVIGFDDNGRSPHTEPPLTTVRVPVSKLGESAVRTLLAFLRGDYEGKFYYGRTVLPVSLIERGSVRKIGK